MKYTYCIPAALAIALMFTGPSFATETKQAATAESPAALDGQPIKGKVLETMDSSGYTYLRIEAAQGNIWVAIPQSKVEMGQEVVTAPGMTMNDFPSKTLNRTFDRIIFSSGLVGSSNEPPKPKTIATTTGGSSFAEALQAESNVPDPHGEMGGPRIGGAALGADPGGSANAIVPASEVKIDKATGDNAQTIEECFEKAKKLDKKTVLVRGKVMKVSKMIMGKNWLHLQDGTGNPMNNTHDLVVTTMAEPEPDSIVLIEGTLHADKDFGAGYKYAVIIEDAKIK